MRILLWALLGIFCPAGLIHAQNTTTNIRPLTIGDTIPADLEITNIYNYPVSKIRLSDLKGKLVILDFWATWCGACVKNFPKLEMLQKQFPNNLVILLVNTYEGDNEEKVNSFIKNNIKISGAKISLPYSLLQTSLQNRFPHKFVPHYIWIDQLGVIKAITDATQINKENIDRFVNNKALDVKMKMDNENFDRQKPLFVEGNGGKSDEFTYRTIISGYKDGLGTVGGVAEMTENRMRLYLVNYPLSYLLHSAYTKELQVPADRIIYETDSSKNKIMPSDSMICYELIIPQKSWKNISSFIKSDLERYLNIEVSKSMRLTKYYALRLNPLNSPSPSNALRKEPPNDVNAKSIHLNNSDTKLIADKITSLLSYPVIDETNSSSKFSIHLTDILDQNRIIKDLERSGFILTEGKRNIEYSVIKQN